MIRLPVRLADGAEADRGGDEIADEAREIGLRARPAVAAHGLALPCPDGDPDRALLPRPVQHRTLRLPRGLPPLAAGARRSAIGAVREGIALHAQVSSTRRLARNPASERAQRREYLQAAPVHRWPDGGGDQEQAASLRPRSIDREERSATRPDPAPAKSRRSRRPIRSAMRIGEGADGKARREPESSGADARSSAVPVVVMNHAYGPWVMRMVISVRVLVVVTCP